MSQDIEINGQILSWLSFRQAVEYLKHDKEKITAMPVKLSVGYGMMLEHFVEDICSRAQEEYKQLRKAGISILGVQFDKDEHFVLWKQLGETKMFRIVDRELQKESQKKVDGLTIEIAEYWNHVVQPKTQFESISPPQEK